MFFSCDGYAFTYNILVALALGLELVDELFRQAVDVPIIPSLTTRNVLDQVDFVEHAPFPVSLEITVIPLKT